MTDLGLMSNSGLLRIKKRRKTPYENQKTASSYLNYILNGLMTDGGGNDNQAQNIHIRMFFYGKKYHSIILRSLRTAKILQANE